MRSVIVTGGAGYIGSHACKALACEGYLPVAVDSLVRGHRRAVRWGPLERCDIADTTRLTALLRQYEPVGVMHFAAFAYVSASMADPARYYVNNVSYTLALLAAMMAAKVRVLVFSSTCATYGAPDVVPIGEACPQVPVNPYGRSKLMIEQILADYRAAYGFRTAVLRYFNAAGSDPDTEIGEDHEPETHLIPLAVRAALFGTPRLQVFGSDYTTRDGTAVRDYIHVSDLAVAHVKALQRLQAGGDSMVFNLGTGRGYSVREVIDTVQRVTGRNVPFDVVARRQGDPAELVSDCARWRDAFPDQPFRYSDLTTIVRTAWQWQLRSRGAGGDAP